LMFASEQIPFNYTLNDTAFCAFALEPNGFYLQMYGDAPTGAEPENGDNWSQNRVAWRLEYRLTQKPVGENPAANGSVTGWTLFPSGSYSGSKGALNAFYSSWNIPSVTLSNIDAAIYKYIEIRARFSVIGHWRNVTIPNALRDRLPYNPKYRIIG